MSSDVHPHCASIPLHPSLSHDEMDDGERACGTGGREGRIIPSECMMNVVIGLKLTGWGGGQVAGREQERACERRRAASAAGSFCLSQSLRLPSLKCDQAKRRQSTPALSPPLQGRKEAKDTHLVYFFFYTLLERL